MEGLIEEAKELLKERSESDVLDAALIAAAQKVEHYEMAGYGCARAFARMLGDEDAARLLQETLDEEGQTDRRLTELAETMINRRAAAGQNQRSESPSGGEEEPRAHAEPQQSDPEAEHHGSEATPQQSAADEQRGELVAAGESH